MMQIENLYAIAVPSLYPDATRIDGIAWTALSAHGWHFPRATVGRAWTICTLYLSYVSYDAHDFSRGEIENRIFETAPFVWRSQWLGCARMIGAIRIIRGWLYIVNGNRQQSHTAVYRKYNYDGTRHSGNWSLKIKKSVPAKIDSWSIPRHIPWMIWNKRLESFVVSSYFGYLKYVYLLPNSLRHSTQ